MVYHLLLLAILPLLLRSILAVDITIGYENPNAPSHIAQPRFLKYKCLDVPPGTCCALPRLNSIFTTWSLDLSATVTFSQLHTNDLAAVFGVWYPTAHTPENDACQGSMGFSRQGPGLWEWKNPDRRKGIGLAAKGASYITLPRILPPNLVMSQWLAAEGILGLIWGGGTWFSGPAAQDVLAGGKWQGSGGRGRRKGRREIRSEEKGAVFAGPPHRWMYPSLVEVDGTTYMDDGAGRVVPVGEEASGNMVYKDSAGTVLNLTDVRSQLMR
ncbi:MAG: hypothetical protein Q9174_006147 [Haloplaca sp. 1 TL-2023]